jgi:hypothetical protein
VCWGEVEEETRRAEERMKNSTRKLFHAMTAHQTIQNKGSLLLITATVLCTAPLVSSFFAPFLYGKK